MQKSQFNKIKPLNKKRGLDFVFSGEKQGKDKLSISFKYFKPECIKIDDFSNFYGSDQAARKATSDFIKILKDISNEDIKSVFSALKKRQLHLNEIKDEKSITLIENILLNGYGFPKRVIDEFEREFFEIMADGDGGRVIFIKEDNVIDPLFIDTNHMICPQASRDLKKKMAFSHPGLLHFSQEQNNYYREEEERVELLKILIEDAKKGQYKTVDELINELGTIIG